MHPSRYVHMFPKQRDLMGFDEVRHCFPVGDHSCSSVYLLREKGKELYIGPVSGAEQTQSHTA